MTSDVEKDEVSFKGQPHRVKGRGFRIPLAERLRASRRVPQAIVKVTGFSHGLHQVLTQFNYISRKGSLPLEKDTGEILSERESLEELATAWSVDFDTRIRSRDTASIVFSMPRGSNVEALRRAVRAVGARAFPDHEWVFGIHQDRDYPHAHMIVKMRGREGEKKLRLRKPDLYRLREMYAEAAREEGVQLAVSPRAARGVSNKGLKQAAYHLRKKGKSTGISKAGPELKKDPQVQKSMELAIAARHKHEVDAYFAEARALRQTALSRQGKDQEKLRNAAKELEEYARSFPAAYIREKDREEILDKANTSTAKKGENGSTRANGVEMER